jgi:hypothetical protein
VFARSGEGGRRYKSEKNTHPLTPCFFSPSPSGTDSLDSNMTIPEEVDIIICGGGSSGCVPAGRLANLDHNLSVLLIEAGENNLNNPW